MSLVRLVIEQARQEAERDGVKSNQRWGVVRRVSRPKSRARKGAPDYPPREQPDQDFLNKSATLAPFQHPARTPQLNWKEVKNSSRNPSPWKSRLKSRVESRVASRGHPRLPCHQAGSARTRHASCTPFSSPYSTMHQSAHRSVAPGPREPLPRNTTHGRRLRQPGTASDRGTGGGPAGEPRSGRVLFCVPEGVGMV
jgi:hypothetical protein